MNTLLFWVGLSTKKLVAVVLIPFLVILTLPLLAVGAMGQEALSLLSQSASATAAETKGFYMGGLIIGNTYAWGNCTYWVYARRLWDGHPIDQYWGNANHWDESAIAEGYLVNQIPSVGSIFQTDQGRWGHVGYVIKVNSSSGDWTISEMNAPDLNVISERTFSKAAANNYDFIHYRPGEL